MRHRDTNAGEADNPFIVEKQTEMQVYDRLPPLLRRALDTAVGEFSAAQALDWIRSGRYTAEQVAALIVGHSREQEKTRMAECPARPTHRRVR